jgi:hypothetical protein
MIRGISVRVHCKRMRKERANVAKRRNILGQVETGQRPQGRGQALLDLNRRRIAESIFVHCGLARLPERLKPTVRGRPTLIS